MINSRALATSSTIVVATAFAICGALVALAPGAVSAFAGWVLHIDLSTIARPISLANYAGGLALFAAFIWVVVALVATLYNRFTGTSLARA